MSKKIKVAVVGVGSCSSALIQGVEFYRRNPTNSIGLMYHTIGGYTADDLEFVVGFDIDSRKVGGKLKHAIYASPNCNMRVIDPDSDIGCISKSAKVFRGPTLDGIAPHMRELPDRVTFVESDSNPLTASEYQRILKDLEVDVVLNYVPVGAEDAARFYVENAVEAGVSLVNCMPTYISTEEARSLEKKAIKNNCTIVGSDMRSAYGASRLSEVLLGSMMDSGLRVTQHIQMNMAAGSTQGEEHIVNGRTANTDFLNMAEKYRLKNKHISKENVLSGQCKVRDVKEAGMTMFAGPSLTVVQKPGGVYQGSDNKIANLDIVAFGFAGARYELTARLSVQDSPNSGGIVLDAIRFCKVARELGVRGYLRGPSAWSQKTSPVQMTTADAKFECDALARRVVTSMVAKQIGDNIDVEELEFTFQKSTTDYEVEVKEVTSDTARL